MALKLRAGISVLPSVPATCTCGFVLKDIADPVLNSHVLSCVHNSQANFTTRHNLLNISMDRLLTRQGFAIYREPTHFSDALRPDGVIQASTPIMYDITFTDSTLTAHHQSVTQNLQSHAVAKHNKYDRLAATNGCKFLPLAMDVCTANSTPSFRHSRRS